MNKEKIEIWCLPTDKKCSYWRDNKRYVLKDEYGNVISNRYYMIKSLGDDHLAICDLKYELGTSANYDEYGDVTSVYESIVPKARWGIIRVNRDNRGVIIPKSETIVVPYLYDGIRPNNLKTVTVQSNGKFSYLDLDINRDSYGKQLVPCMLEFAAPFCADIDGFAKCSIGNTTGYLPRECKPIYYEFESFKLLTEEQAKSVSDILDGKENSSDSIVALTSYNILTGIKIKPGKRIVLDNHRL